MEGIVAASLRVPPGDIERIAAHTPIVMFGRHDVSPAYDSVVGDDAKGTYAALDHLYSPGHRKVAHLTLDEAELAETPHNIRLRTFREFMSEKVGDTQPIVLRTEEGQDPAYESMIAALQDGPEFTAVFAAHDDLAIGALTAVRELRPETSVVGYDDAPIVKNPAFDLTTVHQPGFDMGIRAVELCLEQLTGRTEAVHEVFEPTLRVRSSSFPPFAKDQRAGQRSRAGRVGNNT